MPNEPIIFGGSIPQHYEEYLTPFLFDPFAEDILTRVNLQSKNVLELACGTGCVSRMLLAQMPADSHLTATDIQSDMLDIAKKNITGYSNVSWEIADMTALPYQSDQFDLLICQFGLMLVPDKVKAVAEMFRTLKPGGKLVFNVWAALEENKVWHIGGQVLNSFYHVNPFMQTPGPFSMNDVDTLSLLNTSGFKKPIVVSVKKVGEIESAERAAHGLIQGLPIFRNISQKDPSLIPTIVKNLEKELVKELGDHPLQSPLQAWVFEAEK